jgi:hypothetical protein
VPPALHQDIQDVVVLIHGPTQVMTLAVDNEKDFVEMPFISGPRPMATRTIGIILTELKASLANGLMRDVDTALQQELLGVAVAQAEPVVEPHTMADDLGRKAVVLVPFGSGGRSHAWLPRLPYD